MSSRIDQELRHVSASRLAQLSTIIDEARGWKELLNKLAVPLNLTLESIHRIKRQQNSDKSPTLALLNHWSITGRRRPTIGDLIGYLRLCQLARAEDFVWREILNKKPEVCVAQAAIVQPTVPRAIKAPCEKYQIGDEFKFKDLSCVTKCVTEHCPKFSFEHIYESTNHFCHREYDFESESGARIGDGRFSSVFLAQTHEDSPASDVGEGSAVRPKTVAAKLLKSECNINYLINEINLARKINHANILELLGISVSKDDDCAAGLLCLIYPYMQNGSLLDCLSHGLRCNKKEQISWAKRVQIATQVARGIDYLHTYSEGVIIHRDVKTANILIDSDLNPKLGDFTLVRQLESHKLGETQHSLNVIGTSVYMPPEAFRGDISTKFDIFSFGIVMLELLTGLRPFNEDTNEDLLTYISEQLSDFEDSSGSTSDTGTTEERYTQFLLGKVDRRAGNWDSQVTRAMFKLALKATEARKRDRPEANDILDVLEKLFIA